MSNTKYFLNVLTQEVRPVALDTQPRPIGLEWIAVSRAVARLVIENSLEIEQESVFVRNGKVSSVEYEMLKNTYGVCKFKASGGEEIFWGILLDENYFIFCNNVLEFFGHNVVGRLGRHRNRTLLRKETIEYFKLIDSRDSLIKEEGLE